MNKKQCSIELHGLKVPQIPIVPTVSASSQIVWRILSIICID